MILFQGAKFALVLLIILIYIILVLPLYPLLLAFPKFMKPLLVRIYGFLGGVEIWILGVRYKVIDPHNMLGKKGYLIVSNHQSYLDMFLHSNCFPSSFVTSTDVKRMPFIGQITTMAGCVFVDRKGRHNIQNELKEITDTLNDGHNVTFYPEATSSDGSQVLPFKRSLFEASIIAKKEILPITLNYEKIDGEKITNSNRNFVNWYADMEFFPHLWQMCRLRRIFVSLQIHAPFYIDTDDTRVIRDKAYEIINSGFRPYP